MKIEILDGKIIIEGLDSDSNDLLEAIILEATRAVMLESIGKVDKTSLSFSIKPHIMKEIKQIAKKNEQSLGKIARSFFLMGLTFYRERKTALEKPKGLYLVEERRK